MEQIRLDRQPSVGTDVFRGPTRPAGSAPSTGVECGSVPEAPPLPQGENSWGRGTLPRPTSPQLLSTTVICGFLSNN